MGGPKMEMPQYVPPQQQAGYEPMTFEDHMMLLEKEAELATLRDESQREFMLEQEEMRMALEETERLQVVQEEEAVAREQMRQEREAAGEPVTPFKSLSIVTAMPLPEDEYIPIRSSASIVS